MKLMIYIIKVKIVAKIWKKKHFNILWIGEMIIGKMDWALLWRMAESQVGTHAQW